MKPFWERKSLSEMNRGEWESLCDGCGRCCVHKLEDEVSGEILLTNVTCRLLDIKSGRCSNYRLRRAYVPDCVRLTQALVSQLRWLPESCAYRLISEGKPLHDWHPLISGDPESVHEAGASVRGWTVSETAAGDLENHVVASLD